MEVNRGCRAVTHSAARRLRGHGSRLGDGLQVPAASLLSGGVAQAQVVGLSVGVSSVDLVQPPVLPGADAVEARVAGLRGDQRLGGRGGALGGRGVARQGRHGVRLGLGEGNPVLRAVGTTSQAAVKLAERKVPERPVRLPGRATVGLKRREQTEEHGFYNFLLSFT